MSTLVQRLTDVITEIGHDIKALFARSIPAGGTTGQVLAKVNATDYNVGWVTPSSGGASNVYVQETDPLAPTPYIWFKVDATGQLLDILYG